MGDRDWQMHAAVVAAANLGTSPPSAPSGSPKAGTGRRLPSIEQSIRSERRWRIVAYVTFGAAVLTAIIWGASNIAADSKCGYSPDAQPGSAQYERDRENAITGDC